MFSFRGLGNLIFASHTGQEGPRTVGRRARPLWLSEGCSLGKRDGPITGPSPWLVGLYKAINGLLNGPVPRRLSEKHHA
jgi:hypothetical protein